MYYLIRVRVRAHRIFLPRSDLRLDRNFHLDPRSVLRENHDRLRRNFHLDHRSARRPRHVHRHRHHRPSAGVG